ncbi:MAG: hypothetical protein KF688_00390 [Pirellulales bacterium]|nr:hypothetical protein [Pirellulales bacterium]
MSTTLCQPEHRTTTAEGGLALEVRLVGKPGERYLLRPGKNTFGSSPRCDLRLTGPEMRPLHGLVTCDGEAVRVNRWAPGLQLNGADFVESALEVGDRLTIGSAALELVAANAPVRPERAPAPGPARLRSAAPKQSARAVAETASPNQPIAPATTEAPKPNCSASQAFTDALLARTWTRQSRRGELARRLVDTLRETRRRVDSLSTKSAELEQQLAAALNERTRTLEQQGELQQRLVAAQASVAEAIAWRQQVQADLAAQQSQAAEAAARSAERIAALESELADEATSRDAEAAERHATELAAARRQLADSETRVADLTAELAACRDALTNAEQSVQTLTSSVAKLEGELIASAEETSRLVATVAAAKSQGAEAADARITEAESALAEVRHDLAKSCEENARLADEVASLREVLESSQVALAVAKSEAVASEAKLHAVLVERDQHSVERQQAEARAAAAEQREWQLGEKVEQLRTRLDAIVSPPAPLEAAAESSAPSTISESTAGADETDATSAAIARLRAASLRQEKELDADEVVRESAEPASDPRDAQPAAGEVLSAEVRGHESPSFIDRYRHLLEDEDQELGGAATRSPLSLPSQSAPTEPPASEDVPSDDDAALQAYMEQMMRRVRGESSIEVAERSRIAGAGLQTEGLLDEDIECAPSVREQGNAVAAIHDEQSPQVPLDLESIGRSTSKPSLPTDLNALRELANSSARNAIAKHRKERLAELVVGKVIIASLALGLAAWLIVTSESIDSMSFLGGCEIAVLGAWALWRLLMNILSAAADQVRPAHKANRTERLVEPAGDSGAAAALPDERG